MNSMEYDPEPYIRKFLIEPVGKLAREGEWLPEARSTMAEMRNAKNKLEKEASKLEVEELIDAVRNVDFVVEEYIYRVGMAEGVALADVIQRMLIGRQ